METLKEKINQSPMDTNVKDILKDLLKVIEEKTNPIYTIRTNTNAKEFFKENSEKIADAIKVSLKPKEELIFGATKEEFIKFITETINDTVERVVFEKANQITTFDLNNVVVKTDGEENVENLTTMDDLTIDNTKEVNVKIIDEADMKKQSVKLPNKKLTKK